ncbi:putative sin3 complex subunit [Rosellinia necatrix]|uniref:Putative sin3 complex subunit n=1 Tax=Rosellinia necatrix TaxID=77044 RepID=A0A1S7UML7_ROSNE|nr:putative sin3 complex subunit [Rosellinia necatrix]
MSLKNTVSHSDESRHRQDEDAAITRALSHSGDRSSQTQTPSDSKQTLASEQAASPGSPRLRHVVIPDPVAFRYLEEDKCVQVVERKAELTGYELYLVEQWACSRQSPTLVIVTYTGDTSNHRVVVGVLSVPADEKAWSPRLRVYFKAIHQFHARPRDTPLGELMVTNLSSFPSALTVISVPGGNIKNQRRTFIVNENLKRLGCSGRSGITLSEPIPAAKAKFHQLYKTNDKVSIEEAVIELVKFCQVALYLFGKLDQVYIDGLLCDVTETSIGDWWTEFGVEYFNVEPTDGILGPTTVAALLGLLWGARNRLSYSSAPVPKDVFEIDTFEKGISHFQKYHKFERTRRLDRQTMHKLHTITAKAAAGEGWGVQKAVKSTVTDIGGKRGEMVLGMVGSRDKGGIGDIETTDLDRLIGLVTGERAKWLWHGKPKRTPALDHEKSGPNMILLGKEDLRTSIDDDLDHRRREDSPAIYSTPAHGSTASVTDSPGDKDVMRRGMFKSVARDARSGLGRIKDAMTSGSGLRGHVSRPSRDESSEFALNNSQHSFLSSTSAGFVNSPAQLPGSAQISRAFTWKIKPEEYSNAVKKDKDLSAIVSPISAVVADETSAPELRMPSRINDTIQKLTSHEKRQASQSQTQENSTLVDPSVTGSVTGEPIGGTEHSQSATPHATDASLCLHRRYSITGARPFLNPPLAEARWPRRLSFGDAEEAVLKWDEVADFTNAEGIDSDMKGKNKLQLLEVAQAMYLRVTDIEKNVEPWVSRKIQDIKKTGESYSCQLDELQTMYQKSSSMFQQAHHGYQAIAAEHREHLTEALNRVDGGAAKLEYEITVLLSRVQEVEDSAAQFEIQVEEVEQRAEELKAQLEQESWLHWAVRTLTGVGTGPNITRPRQR